MFFFLFVCPFLTFSLNCAMCCRHDFYNSATDVVLTIFAKGVPADSVVVDFGEQMVCSTLTVVILLWLRLYSLTYHFSL